jgi:hypothetical protein
MQLVIEYEMRLRLCSEKILLRFAWKENTSTARVIISRKSG